MQDIGEFARQMEHGYHRFAEVPRHNIGIDPGVVEQLVKSAYYASLIPDEERFPNVALMSYRSDQAQPVHFKFENPAEPTASAIAKFSHAVGPGGHLYLRSDRGKLQIVGIRITQLDELREYGFGSIRIGNPLQLRIHGPGKIEVSFGGITNLYEAGVISEERLFQLERVGELLKNAVGNRLREMTAGVVESIDDVFNDLLKSIIEIGHGGLLIVAPDPDMSEFSSSCRISCHLLQKLLIAYWDDVADYNHVPPDDGLIDSRSPAVAPHSLALASDVTKLENCIKSIAHLSGVDGAIVMSDACVIVAFNAIIAKREQTATPLKFLDFYSQEVDEADVVGNRGSRHQSALAYVKRVSNSFAIVVSQDGGISAFHNTGNGEVIFERELSVY